MSGQDIRFNRTEVVFPKSLHDGKVRAIAYTEFGQGWQIPLRDMTPNDLRKLADIMEEHGVGSDQFGGENKVCQ